LHLSGSDDLHDRIPTLIGQLALTLLRLKALQQILSVYELLVRGIGRRVCYYRLGRVREQVYQQLCPLYTWSAFESSGEDSQGRTIFADMIGFSVSDV
jgi:hypothetical protein